MSGGASKCWIRRATAPAQPYNIAGVRSTSTPSRLWEAEAEGYRSTRHCYVLAVELSGKILEPESCGGHAPGRGPCVLNPLQRSQIQAAPPDLPTRSPPLGLPPCSHAAQIRRPSPRRWEDIYIMLHDDYDKSGGEEGSREVKLLPCLLARRVHTICDGVLIGVGLEG